MLLAWAVLVKWICGLLMWIVLLVLTQASPNLSSAKCEMGKTHYCCYSVSEHPGAFGTPGRSDPKTDGVQGKFSSKDKNPPEKTPHLHFPNRSCFHGQWWPNWRTPGRGWTFDTQKLYFSTYFHFRIFSSYEKVQRRKNAVPNPSFLSLPVCVTLGRKGLFWPVGRGMDNFKKQC